MKGVNKNIKNEPAVSKSKFVTGWIGYVFIDNDFKAVFEEKKEDLPNDCLDVSKASGYVYEP